MRVLICDDEPDIRLLYRGAFEDAGAEVTVAADADECLRLARSAQPELAVVDLRMPGRDGISLIPQLRGCCPRTRVMMVTAYASVDVFDRARSVGAVECFDKLDFLWRIPALVSSPGAAA